METKYTVTIWWDDENGTMLRVHDKREFDSLEEAEKFFGGFDIENLYGLNYRTDKIATRRLTLVKDLNPVKYDEDGEQVDSEYDPIEYETFGFDDME